MCGPAATTAHADAESIGVDECLEQHRVELTALCGRMLGPSEAEDAVQETFLRAWRSFNRFEGRSSLRSWLYRIARNVCLDMLEARKHRAGPIDLGPGDMPIAEAFDRIAAIRALATRSDDRVTSSPEEAVIERESVRRAVVTAFLHLTPKQRAVLILREVLNWRASEVAELLEMSVPAVNSALQRARMKLRAGHANETETLVLDVVNAELATRYVDAFEQHDMQAFASVVYRDASRRPPRGRKEPSTRTQRRLPHGEFARELPVARHGLDIATLFDEAPPAAA